MVPEFSSGHGIKEISALLVIAGSDAAKLSRKYLESKVNPGHAAYLSHGFRLTFSQNLHSYYLSAENDK